jgi:hypothetical protein
MKKKFPYNPSEVEKKFMYTYYEYFTNYLIFSEQYDNLNQKNLLDSFIKSDYIYYLHIMVKQIEEENIYPTRIIDNFLEFIQIIGKRAQEILDDNSFVSFSSMIKEMQGMLLNIRDMDQTQIYYLEYIKRYSSMERNHQYNLIPVKQLEIDIQVDYLYLDAILYYDDEKKKVIGNDFYSFLQKVLVDFPEIKLFPKVCKNIMTILKERNDEQAKQYMHLFCDKHSYINEMGFCMENVETLYCDTFLKKLLFSNHPMETIEQVSPSMFYSIPFYYCLSVHLEAYTSANHICLEEKKSLETLIQFMREHLNQYADTYKKDFLALINQYICFFNTCSVREDNYCQYTKEFMSGEESFLKWVVASREEEAKICAQVKLRVELCYDIMKYFFSKEEEKEHELEELCEGGIYTLYAIDSLFHDYPKMFFDPIIYERTIELLDTIQTPDKKAENQKRKVIEKIYQIKKDN